MRSVFNIRLATITPLQQSWSPMKATTPWITYRTRFLVKAKQLTTSLSFTDALGRQHSGRKGDFLVESSDGVLRIAPRQIFEDIYVPLLAGEISESIVLPSPRQIPPQTRKRQPAPSPLPPHLARKSPQPVRGIPAPGFRSL
jgi:hypothetical protein